MEKGYGDAVHYRHQALANDSKFTPRAMLRNGMCYPRGVKYGLENRIRLGPWHPLLMSIR